MAALCPEVVVGHTKVVAYLYLPPEHTSHAEALPQRDPDRIAPVLWRSEFRNILAGYMRRKTLAFDEVRNLQAEAESLLAGNEHDVDSQHVLEIVRDRDWKKPWSVPY